MIHFVSGVLAGSELLQTMETAHVDPRFDNAKFAILDLSGCTGLQVTEDEANVFASIAFAASLSRRKNSRTAIVVSDPQLFEFCDRSLINSPLAPPNARRFSSLVEAKRWAMA